MKYCGSDHEVCATVRKFSKRPKYKWRACLRLRKKDTPLRKMPYRACVLSGREQEVGGDINSREDKSGLYCYYSELKGYMLLYH